MSRILVDTNLLIYSIDEDSNYHEKTTALLNSNKHIFFTTSKNLSEFIAVTTRYPKSQLNTTEALEILNDFQQLFTILYPTPESFTLFYELLKKYDVKGLKIHDLEIVSIALTEGIEKIATINEKDFNFISEIEIHQL